MVRFFGGDSSAQDMKGSDGLGPKEEKCRSGFFVSMLSKYDEGRRSESDLAKRTKVREIHLSAFHFCQMVLGTESREIWGRFHKPIFALRQALMLWAKLLRLKNFLKVGSRV